MITPVESSKVEGTEVCYGEYRVTCDGCGKSVVVRAGEGPESAPYMGTARLQLGNRPNVFHYPNWQEISFEFCRGGDFCFTRALAKKLRAFADGKEEGQ